MKRNYSFILILMFALGLWGCAERSEARPVGTGLFSWKAQAFQEGRGEELLEWMAERDIFALYQAISGDEEKDIIQEFLRNAAKRKIAVYLLTGDPEWGLDPSGKPMIEAVERAAEYNEGLPEGIGLRGVLMDTEPYLTRGWDDDPSSVMESYADAMTRANETACQKGLEYIACIPYFYDSLGQEETLERLVREGCGGLAVMNYHKNDEVGQIENEVALARKYDRPITVIYELQPPGTHDLTEANTYYNDGIAAVDESWRALMEAFGPNGLSRAIHEFEAAKEVWTLE